MLEGKVVNNRQSEYLGTIEGACMAAKQLSGILIREYPTKNEVKEYSYQHFEDTWEILNAINSLMECATGIFDSREF